MGIQGFSWTSDWPWTATKKIFLCLTLIILISDLVQSEFTERPRQADDDALLNWVAPKELRKKFPFFLSGFDRDGAPVFFVEYGKWDVRTFLEEGKEDTKYCDKYIDQLVEIVTSPEKIVSSDGQASPDKFIIISDMDGYENRQVTHGPSVQKYLYCVRRFVEALRKKGYNIKRGFFINSNFLFQTVWNLSKPVFGEILSSMELFGTKPDRWRPAIFEYVATDQLPEFLGGTKDHKPVKIYG